MSARCQPFYSGLNVLNCLHSYSTHTGGFLANEHLFHFHDLGDMIGLRLELCIFYSVVDANKEFMVNIFTIIQA